MTNTAIQTTYARWLDRADASLQPELAAMASDEKALQDAFYRDLAFGTGGLRGIVGAGPNRMNIHTIARATQGLADYLSTRYEKPSVAIARDSRRMGREFAETAAEVLAANGIRTLLYPRIEPTPALSWAVRDQACSAGICITASHNPAPYNGYKVYGADGCQITTQAAHDILAAINEVDTFDDPKRMPLADAEKAGLAQWIGDDALDRYIDATAVQSFADTAQAGEPLKVVYTPLHGAGLECVSRILDRIGVDVVVDPVQSVPDGEFPTCPYPNPEVREALEHGLALCDEVHPDLLLATDPDTDRVGIAVPHEGEYVLLTGNEVGILLLDYVCEMRKRRREDLTDKIAITTIVSSAMADALAADRGFQLRRTLTGFKYIGEQIGFLEEGGQADRFMFGFEESYGYLAGAHVRDKDAVVASMLICEMARWHRAAGRNLVEAMQALYERYGFFKNGLVTVEYPGSEGAKRMGQIMSDLRTNSPASIAELAVESVVDYADGARMPVLNPTVSDETQELPPADVLEFRLEGGNKLIIRPSGTEPKVKAYAFAQAATDDEADELLASLQEAAQTLLS
ncbi:MAG: phospho-sugar mutase [Eggerthellaceae bacterium]|nr:phospho-sugar mutase [Eggerthellaceae bacterium]